MSTTQPNNSFVLPTNCPECGSVLQFSSTNIDLFCPNSNSCPAQIVLRLSYYCQRNLANIVGMSEKTLSRLITEFGISDVADLYDLPMDKVAKLESFGQKSADNISKSIESSRKIVDYKFLAGLGIEGIGPEVAKLICDLIETKTETTD
jgi:DNA ligase (NAD+)